jgi:hypothetical protein
VPGHIKSTQLLTGSRASASTFTSSAIGLRPERDSTIYVHVYATAVSGTTPSLAVSLEWSHDGVNFAPADGTADTMTAITAVGGLVKGFTIKAPYFRIKEVVTGTTPSFTRDINVTYT